MLSPMDAEAVTIPIPGQGAVSGLWQGPPHPTACLVLAHGAGAGMTHRSMAAIADGLADRGVASLRYQFPYMERGSGRVDPPPIAHKAVRSACALAQERAGPAPLFAGGRSFGGRMTSQAQALVPLNGVRGLVFFAFRFTRRESHRWSAPPICRRWPSPCCSCRDRGTRSPT